MVQDMHKTVFSNHVGQFPLTDSKKSTQCGVVCMGANYPKLHSFFGEPQQYGTRKISEYRTN
jgi:hypothetical protein